jgi:hypothetical protein
MSLTSGGDRSLASAITLSSRSRPGQFMPANIFSPRSQCSQSFFWTSGGFQDERVCVLKLFRD